MRRTYTIAEIHDRFGMPPEKARRRCERGAWHAKKIDGLWYVSAEDVDALFRPERSAPLRPAAKAALDRAAGRIA